VSGLARGHFHGDLLLAREPPHISAINHTRQPQALRRGADQSLVQITRWSAKPMVEVRDGQPPAMRGRQAVKYFEEHDGINTARNRNEHGLTVLKKMAVSDGGLDVLD
jgi:hypothetical protein